MNTDTATSPKATNPTFDLDNAIGFLIEVTEQLMKRELRNCFRNHGLDLTPYQWIVLHRLSQTDGLYQAEIAELTTRDRPNITRIIDVMERRGLIERRPSPSDRRVNRVFLTDDGREVYRQLPTLVVEHLQHATSGISARDIDTTKRVLKQMSRNLQELHSSPSER